MVIECGGNGARGGDWVRFAGFYPNPAASRRCRINGATNCRTWMCLIRGFIYDETLGVAAEGIPPGTRREVVAMRRVCPECGARKFDFEMVEF